MGMVLSPQCFFNLNGAADVFNHGNIHFWEYMQPGYDALGFISCTGTNFLMRSNAFIDVRQTFPSLLTLQLPVACKGTRAFDSDFSLLGWRVANIHLDRGLRFGNGDGPAEVEVPVCVQLSCSGRSSRANPKCHATALSLGQSECPLPPAENLCCELLALPAERLLCAGALSDHVEPQALPPASVKALHLHAADVHIRRVELCDWSHFDSPLHSCAHDYHLVQLTFFLCSSSVIPQCISA